MSSTTGFLVEGGGILRILYLGVRNSIEGLVSAAFTKSNTTGTAQLVANTTTAGITKLGCLAGSVAAIKAEGLVGAGSGPTDSIVGLYVNDLAGNAYESSSAAASEKGVFVMGMGVYEVNLYETSDFNGINSILPNYAYGLPLYCSQNGLLTIAAGLNGGQAPGASTIIGIITQSPTPANPYMRFIMRI